MSTQTAPVGTDDRSFNDLARWLQLGYGFDLKPKLVASHTSKSVELPVAKYSDQMLNVEVTWFANNFYFYFLGIALRRPIPAALMYPISTVFGDYPLSGNTNTKVAPPVDFLSSYYKRADLKRFGTDCGGSGLIAAMVIRYLSELSKLDTGKIMDIAFYKTRYGDKPVPHGNHIETGELLAALGLKVNKDHYNPGITNLPKGILEEVVVDIFERIAQGESATRVKLAERNPMQPTRMKLAEGIFLPPTPVPFGGLCVGLEETALDGLVSDELQERPYKNEYSKHLVSYLPVQLLGSDISQDHQAMVREWSEGCPYDLNYAYSKLPKPTREFVFSTPNVLDAALTAFFVVKVMAPIMQELLQE